MKCLRDSLMYKKICFNELGLSGRFFELFIIIIMIMMMLLLLMMMMMMMNR